METKNNFFFLNRATTTLSEERLGLNAQDKKTGRRWTERQAQG